MVTIGLGNGVWPTRCQAITWTNADLLWLTLNELHDDVIKWKHFPRYWPFVRGIHRYPVNSPHKGQWRGALIFTLICARINGWVNNCKAGETQSRLLWRHRKVSTNTWVAGGMRRLYVTLVSRNILKTWITLQDSYGVSNYDKATVGSTAFSG